MSTTTTTTTTTDHSAAAREHYGCKGPALMARLRADGFQGKTLAERAAQWHANRATTMATAPAVPAVEVAIDDTADDAVLMTAEPTASKPTVLELPAVSSPLRPYTCLTCPTTIKWSNESGYCPTCEARELATTTTSDEPAAVALTDATATPAAAHPCTVCGGAIGWAAPSGVCSVKCLNTAQGFTTANPTAGWVQTGTDSYQRTTATADGRQTGYVMRAADGWRWEVWTQGHGMTADGEASTALQAAALADVACGHPDPAHTFRTPDHDHRAYAALPTAPPPVKLPTRADVRPTCREGVLTRWLGKARRVGEVCRSVAGAVGGLMLSGGVVMLAAAVAVVAGSMR